MTDESKTIACFLDCQVKGVITRKVINHVSDLFIVRKGTQSASLCAFKVRGMLFEKNIP